MEHEPVLMGIRMAVWVVHAGIASYHMLTTMGQTYTVWRK